MAGNLGGYLFPSPVAGSTTVSASGAVLSGALGDNTVFSGNLASGQVGDSHLFDNSVLSGKIASGQVGSFQLLSGNITTTKIASGGLQNSAIGSGQLFNTNYGSGSILSGSVASGQIGNGHLADNSIVSGKVISGSISTEQISSGGIWNVNLASGCVLSGNIASGQIGANHLANGVLTVSSGTLTFNAFESGVRANSSSMMSGLASGFVDPSQVIHSPGVAKAWVTFTGSGTVSVLRGFNVSSVTDNNVGSYAINFTNQFSGGVYTPVGNLNAEDGLPGYVVFLTSNTTSGVLGLWTINSAGSLYDQVRVYVSVHGQRFA